MPDIDTIIANAEAWTDEAFPEWEALYRISDPNIEWVRANEAFPASDGYTLWKESGPNVHDITQGNVGNSWLLASISSIAEDPQRIKDMFGQHTLNDAGIYTVNLFSLGVPVTVVIDDFIPINNGVTEWVDSLIPPTEDKELWPVLLQKAFAKLSGTYKSIKNEMNPVKSVEALTGAPGSYTVHASTCVRNLYRSLEKADQNQSIMTAMSFTKANDLVMYQNYTILKVFSLPDGQ